MILAAVTVSIIERDFIKAAVWCTVAALLCVLGLMHAYAFTPGDAVIASSPAWSWAMGYAMMALVFVSARVLTRPADDPP